ncbi:MAG: ArsC/Spx/MgsR family protein [Pseudomonadota bacterium]
MKLFGLKTCHSCRKARKALPEAAFFDVREDGVPAEILDAALATFGASLINTASATWRALLEAERAAPPRDLLLAHPALMKRPLIVDGQKMTLGWKADAQNAWL